MIEVGAGIVVDVVDDVEVDDVDVEVDEVDVDEVDVDVVDDDEVLVELLELVVALEVDGELEPVAELVVSVVDEATPSVGLDVADVSAVGDVDGSPPSPESAHAADISARVRRHTIARRKVDTGSPFKATT